MLDQVIFGLALLGVLTISVIVLDVVWEDYMERKRSEF